MWTKEQLIEEEAEKKRLLQEQGPLVDQSLEKEKELEEILETCQANLDRILPFIEEHPETEYIIYFPPYSMIYWEQLAIQSEIEQKLAMYQYAIEQLLPYENVKVYYFQAEEVCDNLDEYRDETHHKPEYNRYIFDCIKEDKNRLTHENYQAEIDKMCEKAMHFDYEALWQ